MFYAAFKYLLCAFRFIFQSDSAALYAYAICNSGDSLNKGVGFIDGITINIDKPREETQRATCSGYKRRNCMKYQDISTPDRLVFRMFGPIDGRRHDMTAFRWSEIKEELERTLLTDGVQYYIYGDPGYTLRLYLQDCFKGSILAKDQTQLNTNMAMVCIYVE